MIYQRNIHKWLLLLRFVSLGLGLLGVFLVFRNLKDYAFILIVLISLGTIYPLTSIKLLSEKLEIVRYFAYGWIPKKTIFQANQPLFLDAFEIEFHDAATWADMESFFTGQLVVRKFRIKQEDQTGKEKRVLITMNSNETKLILQHFSVHHALPITEASQKQGETI